MSELKFGDRIRRVKECDYETNGARHRLVGYETVVAEIGDDVIYGEDGHMHRLCFIAKVPLPSEKEEQNEAQ